MNTFPATLDIAVEQAQEATKKAIADGYKLVQVELVIPEIALQAEALALEFANLFADYGSGVKVMFPDTGAAALAKRNWGENPFQVTDMGSRFTSIESQVSPEDQIFIVACPSSVEVDRAEKLSQIAGDRPVIFLIPQLEDVAVVGIGLAARQLRKGLLKIFILVIIYVRSKMGQLALSSFSLAGMARKEENYELATELSTKPMGEDLERLMIKLTNPEGATEENTSQRQKPNLLGNLQKFLKALSQ